MTRSPNSSASDRRRTTPKLAQRLARCGADQTPPLTLGTTGRDVDRSAAFTPPSAVGVGWRPSAHLTSRRNLTVSSGKTPWRLSAPVYQLPKEKEVAALGEALTAPRASPT